MTACNTVLVRAAAIALLMALLPTGALAQGAPRQLYNKSVTLSWAQGGALKTDGRLRQSGGSFYTRQIYISSAGRLFVRATRDGGLTANGRRVSKDDTDPGANMTPGGGGLKFQGSRLVGIVPLVQGALQLTATFDPSFAGCSLDIILGKSDGKVILMKAPDGAIGEVVNIAVTHAKCAISDGNIFASR